MHTQEIKLTLNAPDGYEAKVKPVPDDWLVNGQTVIELGIFPVATTAITGSDVLTNSSEQAFLSCPRLYHWSYNRGWRPQRDKKPLRMGSAGHAGIDAIAKGLDPASAVADYYDIIMADAATWQDSQQALYDLAIECVTMQCLVEGYAVAWANSQVEIIESEKVFDLPIINPETGAASRTFRQSGKRDRIARLPDGRIVLMETKFISDDLAPDSDYWRILGINQQLSKYILAARADGHDVQSAVQDVVRKPTIKPCDQPERDEHGLVVARDAATGERAKKKNGEFYLTADVEKGRTVRVSPMTPDQWRHKLAADIVSRPEYYYARHEIPRLDSDLDEYQHELWWIADSIRQARNSGRWFRNSGSCKRFNSLCPYYSLCSGELDTKAGVPAGFRQAENVHEELTQAEGEGVE